MAAITVTASGVSPITGNTQTDVGISNDTITAGMPIYKDVNNSNKLTRCDADASLAASQAVGISLHAALAGQPIRYAISGDMNFGSGLTANVVYIAGATAGAINPVADLTTGWYLQVLGLAISTSVMRLGLLASGVAS
jgi:hypothetical protein